MTNTISSRTPDGAPNYCPICAKVICIEPSHPPGDAPCPNCGTLLWFFHTSASMRFYESKVIAPYRDKILQAISENLGVDKERISSSTSFSEDLGADSLAIVEVVMELEELLGVPIPDEEAEKIQTAGDAIEYLAKRILGGTKDQ
jgi:acyl carrier protein